MFVLGHLGVGSRLLFRLRERLPPWPLYLGCLLPDLIDKPLFYGLLWLGKPLGIITGTRTFGHTAIFLLLLLAVALVVQRGWTWALCAGVATHLALDIGGEFVTGAEPDSSIWLAIFWPAYGGRFPVAHFTSLSEHLSLSTQNAYVIAGELLGGAILLRAFWLRRQSS